MKDINTHSTRNITRAHHSADREPTGRGPKWLIGRDKPAPPPRHVTNRTALHAHKLVDVDSRRDHCHSRSIRHIRPAKRSHGGMHAAGTHTLITARAPSLIACSMPAGRPRSHQSLMPHELSTPVHKWGQAPTRTAAPTPTAVLSSSRSSRSGADQNTSRAIVQP